jgi:hypothetical protein
MAHLGLMTSVLLLLMDQFKLKLLTEQSLDITECINKENKHQQIQLLVFLLGLEDFFIELNLMEIK